MIATTGIWNPAEECRARQDLRALQLARLRQTVQLVDEALPSTESASAWRVRPDDIRSLDDVRRLPFLNKDDLRDHFPYGLFASPMRDVVRVHASSGTTGRPTVVGYTRADLDSWAEIVARIAFAAGARPDDIAQVSFGYGLFTGAFGLHYGLERIGATVLPVSGGNTRREVEIMQMFGSTVLVCTPSYALHVAEVGAEMGMRPATWRFGWGCSAPSRGPTRCAARSRRSSASGPRTTTV